MEKYIELLMSWVGKVRLTGAQTKEALREHVDDSKAALPYLPERGRVIDVGTGGGLPGIVWAICRPDLEFVLLDSVRKKCVAVEQMCEELELKNTRVICARAEEYAKAVGVGKSFDLAAARAVTAAPKLAELLAPFVKKNGSIMAFKGPKFAEETAGGGEKSWAKRGLSSPQIIPYGDGGKIFVFWTKK